jgi:peptide/nickel transport system substrate-binding protein
MLRMFMTLLLAFLGLVVVPIDAKAQVAIHRHALVIGNDSYRHVERLQNSRSDARAVAGVLEQSGFRVSVHTDLDLNGLKGVLRTFKAQVNGGDEAVFFFAGHGVEIDGVSYLMPTDITGDTPDQVRDDAVPLQRVLDDLREKRARFSLAIIDACRNNPFQSTGRSIGGGRGLAAPPVATGQMVLYSAGAGQIALDTLGPRDPVRNGVFTRVLLREMARPGVEVGEVMRSVREEVAALAKSVGREQVPALYDQRLGQFFFRAGAPVAAAPPAQAPVAPPAQASPALSGAEVENQFWADAKAINNREAYEAYLAEYPKGRYASLARAAIGRAGAAAVSPMPTPAVPVSIKWAAQNDLLTLDPHSQNHATTNNLMGHVYEGLVTYDSNYRIVPSLATHWRNVTPTLWRFNLRQGVRFHDGSAFTADDVIFSFNRIRQPQGTMQIYVADIIRIVKIDDHTIDVVLNKPVPTLLNHFVTFYIMDKAWAEDRQTERVQDYAAREETFASRNTNGTGPYIIRQWAPGQRVSFTANPNWWGKREGNVTDFTYLPIREHDARLAALLAGNVDLVTDVPTFSVQRLRNDASVTVLDGPEVRTIFIGLDQGSDQLKYGVKGNNPFKDLRVRQALSMVIDRDAIRRTIMRNLSMPAGLMVAPGINGHTQALDRPPPVNFEMARRLLAEAGYPNGFEFTLDCPNNRYVNDEEVCQAVVGMWARLGVRARLNAMPFGPFIAKIQNFDSSAYLLGWGVATYDAQYTLQSLVRTRAGGRDGNFNLAKVSNPQVDRLIDAMAIETDRDRRDAMIREALTITRDQVLYIPLHHQMRPWAMKRSVTITHDSNDAPKMFRATVHH